MSHNATLREFISVPEAASFADVDRATVWKWIKAGSLKAFKTPSGRTRVRRADIIKPRAGK